MSHDSDDTHDCEKGWDHAGGLLALAGMLTPFEVATAFAGYGLQIEGEQWCDPHFTDDHAPNPDAPTFIGGKIGTPPPYAPMTLDPPAVAPPPDATDHPAPDLGDRVENSGAVAAGLGQSANAGPDLTGSDHAGPVEVAEASHGGGSDNLSDMGGGPSDAGDSAPSDTGGPSDSSGGGASSGDSGGL